MPEKTKYPVISNAEWEVMKVLWAEGPLAARDVIAALPSELGWAPKTVKTLLSRLVLKKAVSYEQFGNSYVYQAAFPRDKVTRQKVRSFVDRVLDGSLFPLVAHFLEEQTLSDAELETLRKLIDKHSSRGGPRKEP